VIEADVTLSAIAAETDDAVVDELVAVFRGLQGEHPDWAEFRRSMVDDRRVVARLSPTRGYGRLS
jgi:hypothetical protein